MSKDHLFGIFASAFGIWLMVHCSRAGIRELRSGVARGLNPVTQVQREFVRKADPVGFWVTIIVTFLAGFMGFFFFAFGIVEIVAD
jgi:hypothetical protein